MQGISCRGTGEFVCLNGAPLGAHLVRCILLDLSFGCPGHLVVYLRRILSFVDGPVAGRSSGG
jgi:hypothetical protein